jgi:hypothetical protein
MTRLELLLQRLERLGKDSIGNNGIPICTEAATELRHQSRNNLRAWEIIHQQGVELIALRKQRDELLEALKQALEECIWPNERLSDVHDKARAAIAKVEGAKV